MNGSSSVGPNHHLNLPHLLRLNVASPGHLQPRGVLHTQRRHLPLRRALALQPSLLPPQHLGALVHHQQRVALAARQRFPHDLVVDADAVQVPLQNIAQVPVLLGEPLAFAVHRAGVQEHLVVPVEKPVHVFVLVHGLVRKRGQRTPRGQRTRAVLERPGDAFFVLLRALRGYRGEQTGVGSFKLLRVFLNLRRGERLRLRLNLRHALRRLAARVRLRQRALRRRLERVRRGVRVRASADVERVDLLPLRLQFPRHLGEFQDLLRPRDLRVHRLGSLRGRLDEPS
mmetsp:Transcript_6543/g.26627  ORF Transcript_6543/g.26627 Transcript_6543/m.26627 type:complete len:285 (+) Transcript_6543:2883-3737(+)